MFSNILLIPFVGGTFLFLFLAWKVDEAYSVWMLPCLLISALVYIMKPEIDWWWHSRRPPKLPEGMVRLLERFCDFYRRLDPAGRQKFRDRIALFHMGTDWMPMGWPEDELPGDVQLAISVNAVMLTWNKPTFLFDKFEKVIVYPLPFPTLDYQFAHASELHEEDGCLLFSAKQLMEAFVRPPQLYNVGLHEYAKVFCLTYPGEPWPAFDADEQVWTRLERVGNMPRSHVEAVIGIAGVAPLPVAIHHYFVFRERFMAEFEQEAAVFKTIFGEP